MGFHGQRMLDISTLQLTQIYLSQKKIAKIFLWFDPSLKNFEPIPVRDFLNNGSLHMTDGHSRAFAAWKNGVKQIPCVYDEDEIVACTLGQIQYEKNIEWCRRFHLQHISDLEHRILPENEYEELWIGRCEKMHHLEKALLEGTVNRRACEKIRSDLQEKGFFIYGISENLQTLCVENSYGQLFEIPFSAE